MKICPYCQIKADKISKIEVVIDGKQEMETHACTNCCDHILESIYLYDNEELQESTIVLTPEELKEVLSGNLQSLESELFCDNCGLTKSEFLKTGYIGCAECYDTFTEILDKFFLDYQDDCQHVGRVPKNQQSKFELIKHLKLKLAHAKEIGDFVEASNLVNKISEISLR